MGPEQPLEQSHLNLHVFAARYLATLALLVLATLLTTIALPSHAGQTVPGGVYSTDVPAQAQDVRFNNKPVMRIGDTVFVGISMSHALGQSSLTYTLGGESQNHHFDVVDKAYSEQHITIKNKAMVDPPAETLTRIRSEASRQRKLYTAFNEAKDLTDGFIQPLQGIVTSQFGHRRFFNGKPRNPHSGLDIAGDTGAPIMAAGNGRIVLAGDLYFNGNTLFVDHGQGLITMYCHMSKLLVAEGDLVAQGQTIGLVGATGRVTGPHLHWSVSLGGARVDPLMLMRALNASTERKH